MRILVPVLTLIVAFGDAAAPAYAEQAGGSAVTDALNEVLGLEWHADGHVVQHREATLVLRADDRRVYIINTAGLDTAALARLKDGHAVTVALKRPTKIDAMPIAATVTARPEPARTFRRVDGVVEAVSDEQITFRTRDGLALTLDAARIVGEPPRVTTNETATLIYEQEPALAGVWIDNRETQPAALTAPRR